MKTTPPGEPALSPDGRWPTSRFDARNTGGVPTGAGLRDGEVYWRLNAGGGGAVADGRLVNVHSRGRDRATVTYRTPATAAVEQRVPLVEYGVNQPPTLADGQVYLTTFIEAFCFDADGSQRWRGPAMDGIRAPPTVSCGRVFVTTGGFDGVASHLRALDADEGTPLWRFDVAGETWATPAVADSRVFVTTQAGLHAVDAESGRELYRAGVSADRGASPVVAGDSVIVAGERLSAVALGDGTVRWQRPVAASEPPVVADGVVYARTDEGLVGLDSADGRRVRRFERAATPLAVRGSVVYAETDGELFAFDRASGDTLWSVRTESVRVADTVGRQITHVTPVDGAVYVAARDAFYGIGPA